MSADRIVTREILNDWILNDGLEHLFAEGYLPVEDIDPDDYELIGLIMAGHQHWAEYQTIARQIENLVGFE